MSDKSSSESPFISNLTVALIVLKLTGFIDWPWWQVTAPLWGFTILMLLAVALLAWWTR